MRKLEHMLGINVALPYAFLLGSTSSSTGRLGLITSILQFEPTSQTLDERPLVSRPSVKIARSIGCPFSELSLILTPSSRFYRQEYQRHEKSRTAKAPYCMDFQSENDKYLQHNPEQAVDIAFYRSEMMP